MGVPINISIPPGLVLDGGYVVRFKALDATTGADVTTVVVRGATVQYDSAPAPLPIPKNTAVFLAGPLPE